MSAPIEAILAEIGKAFRLCRFYPASHPSVQQSLASVSSVLPDLSKTGPVELKITPTGFMLASRPLAPRNPPVQELAGLLYTQGHRFLQLDPGLTADEVAALIRAATSSTERAMRVIGGDSVFEHLKHIRLERTSQRAAEKPSAQPRQSGSEGPMLGRRSMSVFRPDALPPEIEVKRLATSLEQGEGVPVQSVNRLSELVPEIIQQNDFRTLTVAVRALGKAMTGSDQPAADAAAQVLATKVGDGALAGLVSRLGDTRLPAVERDEAVQAVAALGARGITLVADAFMVSSDTDERDILLAVVRRAGDSAAELLLARVNPDTRGETARSYVLLLGATRAPSTALVLGVFAMHAEPLVREAAVTALSRLEDSEASRLTATALRDGDARVRAAAARGIAWFGDVGSGPILIGRLEEEEDDDAAIAMIEAIGELRDVRAVKVLAEITRGVSGVFQRHATQVRVSAINALGAIGSPDARAELQERLNSRHPDVRQAAARALAS